MQTALPRSWKEEFAVAAKRDDILYRERIARFEEQQKKRKEEERNEQTQNDTDILIATVLAAPEEVAEFRVELDQYDAATVDALMDNQQQLDDVRERINDLLDEAYVMPDGTKFFKTRDGLRVFDEHGTELPADMIDPASIDDKKPRWETFSAEKQAELALEEQRQKLFD